MRSISLGPCVLTRAAAKLVGRILTKMIKQVNKHCNFIFPFRHDFEGDLRQQRRLSGRGGRDLEGGCGGQVEAVPHQEEVQGDGHTASGILQ